MIMDVSPYLLYLIFGRFLGWRMLLGRTSSPKDVDLLVQRHDLAVPVRPTPSPNWTGPTQTPCPDFRRS